MGLFDGPQYQPFHDPNYQDPAMDSVWLALMRRPKRSRVPRPPKGPRPPRAPMPVHAHRCGHPWVHRLLMLAGVGSWLYWSLSVTPQVGLWLAYWLDPSRSPWHLPIRALTPLFWFCGVIPAVTYLLCLGLPWRCGGLIRIWQDVMNEPLGPPTPPGRRLLEHPVMIERVMLTPEEAARRGLPGPVIVERIHYQREH